VSRTVAAAVATFVGACGVAVAASQVTGAAADTTIKACAKKSEGTLRLGETCATNENAVSWNAQGPAGGQGRSEERRGGGRV